MWQAMHNGPYALAHSHFCIAIYFLPKPLGSMPGGFVLFAALTTRTETLMPLPPAPTKRAARVAKEAFDITANAPKRSTKTQPTALGDEALPPVQTLAAAATPASAAITPPAARRPKKSVDNTAKATATASAATTAAAKSLARQRAAMQASAPKAHAAPTLAAAALITAAAPTTPTAQVAAPVAALAPTPVAAASAPVTSKAAAAPASKAPVPTAVPTAAPVRSSKKRSAQSCLFVLDTNVLLHDPTSLFRFQEHDIYLPMVVLEELDAHKKGMTEVARNGRQVSRTLDALVDAQKDADLAAGLQLNASGHKGATGRLFF